MKKKSNSEKAYDYLKNEIVMMKMPQGTPVNEREIADTLGISRTPVREAIHRLEAQGLLSYYPYQGTIVANIYEDDIIEICELREMIETWAIGRSIHYIRESDLAAVEKNFQEAMEKKDWALYHVADNALHTLIIEKSGSQRTMTIFNMLNTQIERFRNLVQQGFINWDISYQEHMQLIQLIRERDCESCRQLLEKHLKRVKKAFVEVMLSARTVSQH
jgi:DNA-binding GntR family transcriptional regulator